MKQPFTSLTLNQVLGLLGMTTEPRPFSCKLVRDVNGNEVGEFTAAGLWDHLKSTGLLHTARQEHGRAMRGVR